MSTNTGLWSPKPERFTIDDTPIDPAIGRSIDFHEIYDLTIGIYTLKIGVLGASKYILEPTSLAPLTFAFHEIEELTSNTLRTSYGNYHSLFSAYNNDGSNIPSDEPARQRGSYRYPAFLLGEHKIIAGKYTGEKQVPDKINLLQTQYARCIKLYESCLELKHRKQELEQNGSVKFPHIRTPDVDASLIITKPENYKYCIHFQGKKSDNPTNGVFIFLTDSDEFLFVTGELSTVIGPDNEEYLTICEDVSKALNSYLTGYSQGKNFVPETDQFKYMCL